MAISPELTGGLGFTYEDSVSAFFLAALLAEDSVPGLGDRVVRRVALQQANFGEPLDDLIVDGQARDGSVARLSAQVKRALTISAAASNTDFREIVTNAWATLQKDNFREDVDRVGAVTGTISDASLRDLSAVCEWARSSADLKTFQDHLQPGAASKDRRAVVEVFSSILGTGRMDVYRLLRHFQVLRLDVLGDAAVDESSAVNRLRSLLPAPDECSALWSKLRTLAGEGAAKSAEFSRAILLRSLQGSFVLNAGRSYRGDLAILRDEARAALESIAVTIQGVEVSRPRLLQKAKEAIAQRDFVNIVGLPGAGKSGILRALAQNSLTSTGTPLVLKSDRLSGKSWRAYASDLGIAATLDDLIAELASTGNSVIFIGGIDGVEASNRGVITDLLNAVLQAGAAAPWKVVVTSRDSGIEPLRTWLPGEILRQGIETVDVGPFSEEECSSLAEAIPLLRPLLYGDAPLREIARRPFFASVLCRTGVEASAPPRSEIDLVDAWWKNGGYQSLPDRVMPRQRALIALARTGASTLGRRINLRGLSLEGISDLKSDGLIAESKAGHTVRFTHDIFFEWAFLHVLLDADEDTWIMELITAGEPPALGRVVELMSQATLSSAPSWKQGIRLLESAGLRPQWLRAWLVAPFGLPTFKAHAATVEEVVFEGGAERFRRLMVWYQAEKTIPNPRILESRIAEESAVLDTARMADLLAWPSDFPAWRRFCTWLLAKLDRCPLSVVPDVLTALEVWQNALAQTPNSISADMVKQADAWLRDLETRVHAGTWPHDYGPWENLADPIRKELEQDLRRFLLRAAPLEVDRIHSYLQHVIGTPRLRSHAFGSIIAVTTWLASTHAQDLADLMLAELRNDLPKDQAKKRRSPFGGGFSYHDWHDLAIHTTRPSFFAAAPTREPFASLFQSAPDTARHLVRELTNHAITAWRQLFSLVPENRGTPLPLVLRFPWGEQTFWGDTKTYVWPRGTWGPAPVASGLMALEHWALSELDKGRDTDEVIRQILEGHESIAAVAIATTVALRAQRVSATTLPLATSQAIWHWDIARLTSDRSSSHHSNLIGFTQPSDLAHARAVRASNELPVRGMEIRALAMLFVLGSDQDLAAAARRAIVDFPKNLPFELEEQRTHEGYVADLRRTAEIWAEFGKPEHYAFQTHPDNRISVALASPRLQEPDIVAANQRHERMGERLTLVNWVNDSLEKRAISSRLPIAEALSRARALYREGLLDQYSGPAYDIGFEQGAVAGSAAALSLYGGQLPSEDLAWLREVVLQAATTQEARDDNPFAGSLVPLHPCLLASRGLEGLIRRDPSDLESKAHLLALTVHPMEHVSTTAIGAALALWDIDRSFAFLAFNMAVKMSIGQHRELGKDDEPGEESHDERCQDAARSAIEALQTNNFPSSLPLLPPAWEGKAEGPKTYLRWDFLPKVLHELPVNAIARDAEHLEAVLAFCDSMVHWFEERLQPKDDQLSRRHSDADVMELESKFFYKLGLLCLHLDCKVVNVRFLAPLLGLKDKPCASAMHPFVEAVVAAGLMDPPEISETAKSILVAVIDRLLTHRSWAEAREREGDIYGYDLPPLVRTLLLVHVQAMGAARFANDDWSDVTEAMPVIDPFVRAVGDIPYVTETFLTLCERSRAHYPVEQFVDQVTAFLSHQEGIPVGWRGSSCPSRIAALIHAFAERATPLPQSLGRRILMILDRLVDMGDRRSAALQNSETFRAIQKVG